MSAHEEPHIIAALSDLCRKMNITCLVQVGAGDGYEADYIARHVGCRAVAIEGTSFSPPWTPNLDWYSGYVIGATDCEAMFYIHSARDLSSTIPRVDENQEGRLVKQHRLDTFCRDHYIDPDALIIDTEGTTLDVLEGAGSLLRTMRLIYAECQTDARDPAIRLVGEVDVFLSAYGFTQHTGLPAYSCGGQGNFCWIRP